jgi:hypothetical protein
VSTPTFFLDALAQSGMSIDKIPTAPLRWNPLVTVTSATYKEAHMGTLNHTDVKPAVEAAIAGPKGTRVSIKDAEGKHAFYVRVPRPLRQVLPNGDKSWTTGLITLLETGDEQAADEVYMRLRHAETLKPHNAKRLQKAFDAFLAKVPEYVDPVAIAVAEREAELEDKAREAEEAPVAVEAPVAEAATDEVSELRSQVWALTVAVKALAEGLGVEVPA